MLPVISTMCDHDMSVYDQKDQRWHIWTLDGYMVALPMVDGEFTTEHGRVRKYVDADGLTIFASEVKANEVVFE